MVRIMVPPSTPSRPTRIPPHIAKLREDIDAAIEEKLGKVSGLVRSRVVQMIEGILDRASREISAANRADDKQPRSFVFSKVIVSRSDFEAAKQEFKDIRQHSFVKLTEVQKRYLDILYLNIFENKSYEELGQQFSLSAANVKTSILRGRVLISSCVSENLHRVLSPNIRINIVESADPRTQP